MPTHVKVSHPRGTKLYIRGGNKSDEAIAKEIPGRNASECIEPRNARYRRGRHCHLSGRRNEDRRQGEFITALSGSEATAWYEKYL
jgi:hypothetical protein